MLARSFGRIVAHLQLRDSCTPGGGAVIIDLSRCSLSLEACEVQSLNIRDDRRNSLVISVPFYVPQRTLTE